MGENRPAKPGHIRSFKRHSTATRLPRKEAEIRRQLYEAVERAVLPSLATKAGRGR